MKHTTNKVRDVCWKTREFTIKERKVTDKRTKSKERIKEFNKRLEQN